MNLHIKTVIFILGVVGIGAIVLLGMQHFPLFTLTTIVLASFAVFYNLIYSFLKIEQSIEELKRDK